MKSLLQLISSSLLILFFCSNILLAQWEPDVRFTNDSFSSFTNNHFAPCIAVNGDSIHIVWFDNSSAIAFETRYGRSTDGGLSWDRDTILSSTGNNSWSSSVIINGQYVYVAWTDQRDGNDEIYFKRSTDGGLIWDNDDRITNTSLTSVKSSVAATGSDVHVVYRDHGLNQAGEIRYRRSTDYGSFWSINSQLTNDPAISNDPKVAAFGQIVHVVWTDSRDGNYEIYYKRSSDRGVNWSLDTRLTLDVNNSQAPQIAVSGSFVHLLWQDDREGITDIYYKRSTDEGLSWSSDIPLTANDTIPSYVPTIAVSGPVLHIVWLEYRDQNYDIYHKRTTDNGESWSDNERLTNNPATLENHSVTVSGQAVYVVWKDYRDGSDGEIYYKRNLTGEPTDVEIINEEIPKAYSLEQNYPNPFNPATKIKFKIPSVTLQDQSDNWVTLKVYDILGREIATLVDEDKSAGSYDIIFDGKNHSTGVYIYKLTSGNYFESKKMLLLK